MEFGRPFKAFFADPEWGKKLGLGVLVSLIPYVGQFIVMGYALNYQLDVARGRDERLPSWSDFQSHGMKALGAFVVQLVYMLPAYVAGVGMAVVVFAGIFAAAEYGEDVFTGSIVLVTVFGLLAFVAMLALLPLYYSALINYNVSGRIEGGFEFRTIWATLKRNFGKLLVAILMTMAASLLIVGPVMGIYLAAVFGGTVGGVFDPTGGFFTVFSSCCGWVFYMAGIAVSGFAIQIVSNHYFGQYVRIAYGPEENWPTRPKAPAAADGPYIPAPPVPPAPPRPPEPPQPPASGDSPPPPPPAATTPEEP